MDGIGYFLWTIHGGAMQVEDLIEALNKNTKAVKELSVLLAPELSDTETIRRVKKDREVLNDDILETLRGRNHEKN